MAAIAFNGEMDTGLHHHGNRTFQGGNPLALDGRGLISHSNNAFFMEDEAIQMEIPDDILFGSIEDNEDDEELYIELSIENKDQRFGFSVIGGKEDGYLPQVDEIIEGSPADRSDLQVGDEILSVNGRSLADASHAEVIAHIHQCVKSKTINLRVKRRMGKSIDSDPESRRIQEAYVIAVEQQSKDRIGHLSNKHNVPTTDLSNLPPLKQHPENTLLNGYTDDIAKTNNNRDLSNYAIATRGLPNGNINHGFVNGETVEEPSVKAVRLPRQKRVKLDGWVSNSESSSVDDCRDFDFDTSRTVTANVEIPPHGYSGSIDSDHFEYSSGLVQEPHLESVKLAQVKAPPVFDELERRLASGDNLGLNNNVNGLTNEEPDMPREVPVDVPANFVVHSPNGIRNSSREVAVDCPPSFVAASGMKNPPQQYHNGNPKHNNNYNGVTMNGPSNGLSNGPKNGLSNGPSNGLSNGPTLVNGTDHHHAHINSHNNVVDNRTRNHKNNKQNLNTQNDMRQKVPNDRRQVVTTPTKVATPPMKVALPPTEQNVSHNNSQGATVFEPASTRPLFDGKASTSSEENGFQTDNHRTAVGLDELLSSLEHVQSKLGGAGDQTNVSFLQELFCNSDFQHAVRVHQQVEDIHRRPDPPLPYAADSEESAIEILNTTVDSRSREVSELRRILNKPLIRSLLNTHDRIASRDPGLMLPPEDDDDIFDQGSEDAEDAVRMVRIDKTAEPLVRYPFLDP